MSKNKLPEMKKADLLKLPNAPEFVKASLRVLEGKGFENLDAALNGATVVAAKDELSDRLFNGVAGFALEGRVRDIAGATQRDMAAALDSDFYVINNGAQMFIKCNGRNLAEILKDAVERGQESTTTLKSQAGFDGTKELSLRPITEYNQNGKFQRYLTDMERKRDEEGLKRVHDLLEIKTFDVRKLFDFSKEVATANYYNIDSATLDGFEKEAAAQKLTKATGGFF